MRIFSTRRLKKNYIILLAIVMTLLALWCVITFILSRQEIETLNDGWRTNNSKTINLPKKVDCLKHEAFTISKTLPEDFNEAMTIVFRSNYQFITVEMDGDIIYEYNLDGCPYNVEAPASKWNFVDIPKNSAGKTLEISYMSPYAVFSSKMANIFYSENERYVIKYINYKYLADIALGIAFFIMGLVSILWFIIKLPRNVKNNFLYLGEFLALFGVWSITENRTYEFFIGDMYINNMLSIALFSLFPISFCMYAKSFCKTRYRKIYDYVQIGFFVNLVGSLFLQLVGAVDLVVLVPVAHALLWVVAGAYTYIYLKTRGRNFRSPLKWIIIVVCYGTGVCDFALYYTDYYEECGFIFRIGVFVFFVANGIMFMNQNDIPAKNASEIEEITNNQISLVVSQLHPHFTFNALNTIRYNVKANPDLAYDMLYDFSNYIRGNIDSLLYSHNIDFLTEICHLKSYTNIEKERFKEKLEVEYDLQEVNFMLPPLTILPLVENAIKHGVRAKSTPGKVVIKSYVKMDFFVVDIIDDGIGFDVDEVMVDNSGKGINNVIKNLEKVQGARLLMISEDDKGTTARIKIPKI